MQKIYLFILVMILNIQYLSSSQIDFDNLSFAHSEANKKANSLDAELSKYFPANNIKTIISDFLHKKKPKKNTNNLQSATSTKNLKQKSIKINNATNTDLYRALDPYLPKSLHAIVGQYLDSYEIIREFSVENSQFNYLQNSGKLFSIVDDHLQIFDLRNHEVQRVKFKSDFNARDIIKFYELKDGFFIFLTKHKALYSFDTKSQVCSIYTGDGNELTLANDIPTNAITFEDLFLLINKSFATIDSQNILRVWTFTEVSDGDDKIFSRKPFEHDSRVITVCRLNRNIIISCTDNGMILQWDYNTQQNISTENFGVQIGLMQLSDGIMIMQDQNSQIRICDKTGITKKIILLLDENDKIINLPNFLPQYKELNDNKLMVSLGNYIYIIDLNTVKQNNTVNPILTMPNGKIIEGFAMLSNENIVTLDNTGSIQIWAKQFKHMTQSNQSFSQKTEFDKVDMECLTQY